MARLKYWIQMLLATTVCFILHISICLENPGMRVQIGQAGLDYANEMCLNKIHAEFQSYTFETFSKDFYRLYNVKINNVSHPTGDVTLVFGKGLKWNIRIQRYKLSADLKYNATMFSLKQEHMLSLPMDLSPISLQLTLEANKTSNGGLSLKAVNCGPHVNVQVSSSNLFVKIALPSIRRKINSVMEKKLCDSAIKIVNKNVAEEFSDFLRVRWLKYGYAFDYRLISDPVFTTSYMQTNHNAAVLSHDQYSNYTSFPRPLPKFHVDRHMIWFTISNFVLNTWLYTAYYDGKLKLNVTKEKFKTEKRRNMLRTNCPDSFCMATFYPKVSKDYPNRTVEIFFSAITPPTVEFRLHKIHLVADVLSKFNVLTSDGKSFNVFSANLVLDSELGAKLTGSNIIFTVTKTFFKVKTMSCIELADLDVGLLQKYLRLVANNLKHIVPAIPLPLTLPSNTMIKNEKMAIIRDALIVGSNLTIIPI